MPQPEQRTAERRPSAGTAVPHAPLAAALEAASLGYPSFALKPKRKDPATKHGLRDATTDPATLRAMFTPRHNVGIAWPPGVLAIDLDVPKDEKREPLPGAREYADRHAAEHEARFPELRTAPRVRSRADGVQWLVRLPDGVSVPSSTNAVPLEGGGNIDLRGDGRTYTAAPPSTVAPGRYAWERPLVPIAGLPVASADLVGYLTAPKPSRNGQAHDLGDLTVGGAGAAKMVDGDPEVYAAGILEGTRARLGAVKDGRNAACYDEGLTLGRWVGGYKRAGLPGLDEHAAAEALRDAMRTNGDYAENPPKAETTIRNGLRDGMGSAYTVTHQPKPRPTPATLGRDPTDPGPSEADAPPSSPRTPAELPAVSLTEPPPTMPNATARTLAPTVDEALAWYADTDAGNAERFVHYTRGSVRYAAGLGWLLWTGTHWAHDPSELVLRFALDTIRATHATSALLDNPERRASLGKHARASEALGRLRAMLDLARVRPEVHVLPDQLDADPWVLNTMSGLVNLRDATQRPHDAAALCTKLAPAVFDLGADHPALHALLDVLDQDGRAEYIRDTIGQALTGRSAKAVHVWTGPSGTVKSTTADAATAVLGAYAVSVEPSTLIVSKHGASAGGARADLVALRGARLAVSAEMPNGGRLDSELVKRLTGRDPITARPPYAREALTFIPGHTLVMHSNHEPRVDWTDDGMRARLAVVPFTVRPSNPDPRIRTALIEDADARAAVLAWATVGAARWYRNGERAPDAPDVVQERTRALWANQDPFAVWAEDALVFGTGAGSFTPTADLARSYQAWCEANGERPMSARALGHWLAARADSHGLTSAKHGKAGTRGWTGLRLRGPTG